MKHPMIITRFITRLITRFITGFITRLTPMPVILAVAVIAALQASCASPSHGPYAPITEGLRDTVKAQKLNQDAAKVIHSDPARAESLLRDALTADLYLGPAHNNLGVVYLDKGELYSAAGEFEWARKLMPGHPDPRMNLALTLERAGRTDEALSTYASALEADPSHIQSIQALTRLQLRTGKTDDQTRGHLDEIAMRGTSEKWRAWAREQVRSLSHHSATSLVRDENTRRGRYPRETRRSSFSIASSMSDTEQTLSPRFARSALTEADLDRQVLAQFDRMRVEDDGVREWFRAVLASQTKDA